MINFVDYYIHYTERLRHINNAVLNAPLGVEDIRVEMRGMRGRIDTLSERLSAVESSCKSAHHRLDQMAAHPPD